MSDNKYIIDKDSLTGIADAVRDKLGTGEATTDPQTGDIIYPEDKGYYLKQGNVAGFIYPGDEGSQTSLMNVSNETVQELCGGIVPTYIKFTVLALASSYRAGYNTACGLLYNGTKFYVHAKGVSATYLLNVVGSTKTISYNSTVGCQIIGTSGTYSSEYQTFSYFELPGSIKIEFLDENEDNILTSIEGPISAGLPSYNYTMEIPIGMAPERIPYSIDDIRNKIVNNLSGLSEGGLKIFKCYNNSSISSSEGDGWKVSNYLGSSAYFNLNFSSTSPYITTQVPDLNPENIIYMRYIGKKNQSGYTYTRDFVFDPTLKDVEHYTSASTSKGKRLSSATDYYFFPDGAGYWSSSNDYGIMGMWDANNKILDLGLQKVSSRSGTYVASNYTTQYYNIPVGLVIVYKT